MRTDGIVELLAIPGRIMLLKEDKNEFGEGGSDTSTPTGLSLGRSWAQDRFKTLRLSTNCATFLIATAGTWVGILGAVLTDGVIVQRLTDYVWVGLASALSESHITKVARIFYALKTNLNHTMTKCSQLLVILPLVHATFLQLLPTIMKIKPLNSNISVSWKTVPTA